MIRELHYIIPKVSKTTIHEAVTEKFGYRKLCASWVPKMLMDDHRKFKWDVLDHLLYSPDLVAIDFHLFLHLNKHLAGKTFDDNDEVQEEIMWFKGQVADFYDLGIQKLVPRLNKCLVNAGDCVEK
jgi:hypothetical protein